MCVCVRDTQVSLPRSLTRKTGAVIRNGLQASRFAKADGKCPEILDIPPHPPSNNAGNGAHYLQQTEENRFLNEHPPHPRQCCALRQGPCSPAFPQYSIAHISFLQSGIKSSNLIISAQPPRHPLHSAFTAVLESVWQGPPSSGAAQQKEASGAQDGLFCSVKQNLAHQTF